MDRSEQGAKSMAGTFLKQIERARAAAKPTSPEKSPSEMPPEELDAAIVEAKWEVVEANKAVAAETNRPATTLSQVLGDLQKKKRRSWR